MKKEKKREKKKEGSGRCQAWGLEFTVILKADLALTQPE